MYPYPRPVFFAATKSFWLTVVGILLVLFEAPSEVLYGLAEPLSLVLPWTGAQIGDTLNRVAPAILWALAIQQRAGAARPYTIDPKATE